VPDPSLKPERPEYYVQTGSMFENPYGVPHEEIVSMLLELPSEVAAQVVFGKYVESSGLVFTSELIEMAVNDDAGRVTGDRWHDADVVAECKAMPFEGKRNRFHTGIDYARQTDYTVISVLDTRARPAQLVYYRRLNRVPWESIYREVGRALAIFGPSALADSTGMAGDVIMDAIESRRYCPVHDQTFLVADGICIDRHTGQRNRDCGDSVHISLGSVDGYPFSQGTKRELLEHFRNVLGVGYVSGSDLDFGWLRMPRIVQAVEEMSFYTWLDKGLETDVLMSIALACWQGLEDAPAPAVIGSMYGD
jgi:hypothetical protein